MGVGGCGCFGDGGERQEWLVGALIVFVVVVVLVVRFEVPQTDGCICSAGDEVATLGLVDCYAVCACSVSDGRF